MPESYGCFHAIFGYTNDVPGPLYSEPPLQELLPQIAKVVPPAKFVVKLVGLSVRARWEADQTGALQDATRAVLQREPALFLRQLAELESDEEYSVWRFLVDGPHPSDLALPENLVRFVCEESVRSCHLYKKAHASGVAEEQHH